MRNPMCCSLIPSACHTRAHTPAPKISISLCSSAATPHTHTHTSYLIPTPHTSHAHTPQGSSAALPPSSSTHSSEGGAGPVTGAGSATGNAGGGSGGGGSAGGAGSWGGSGLPAGEVEMRGDRTRLEGCRDALALASRAVSCACWGSVCFCDVFRSRLLSSLPTLCGHVRLVAWAVGAARPGLRAARVTVLCDGERCSRRTLCKPCVRHTAH